jgi:hypothetical protein
MKNGRRNDIRKLLRVSLVGGYHGMPGCMKANTASCPDGNFAALGCSDRVGLREGHRRGEPIGMFMHALRSASLVTDVLPGSIPPARVIAPFLCSPASQATPALFVT